MIAWGAATDRWSHKGVLLAGLGLTAFSVCGAIGLSVFANPIWAFFIAFAFGLCIGVDSVWLIVLRTCFGERDFGAIYGVFYFVLLTTLLLAPIAVGHIYDVSHSYLPAFAGLFALTSIGFVILAWPGLRVQPLESKSQPTPGPALPS